MNIEVLADSGSVAQRAAFVIAEEAWAAIATRGLFVMAVSGGHTPWIMLRALAAANQEPAAGDRQLPPWSYSGVNPQWHSKTIRCRDVFTAPMPQSVISGLLKGANLRRDANHS